MDALTLTAITRELCETIAGGRIQAVLAPDEHSLALEVFARGQRHWLLLSAHPQYARVHLLPIKARRGLPYDAPLVLLARKRLLGARLSGIFQPSWERVLFLTCEHSQHGQTRLTAEIMGKWSNLLLLDADGIVLEMGRHFDVRRNQQRRVQRGAAYEMPPPQRHKTPVDLVTQAELEQWLAQAPTTTALWRLLLQQIGGISPLLARELAFRATGDRQASVAHPNCQSSSLLAVVAWVRSLPGQGGWAPTIALHPTSGQPTAFAPYQLTHLGQLQYVDSISEAAHTTYAAIVGADSYAGRRRQVQRLIELARRKLVGRRISLGEQAVSDEQVAELRRTGEWILAYAWRIQPGDSELLADTGAELLRIPLDSRLSASENAQQAFARYRKAQRAARRIPALLAGVDRDLAYIEQLQSDLHLADNAPQIEELRQAVLELGLVPTPKKRAPMPRSHPLKLLTDDGLTVIIGRNALQNEHVTWKLAHAHDLWLHAEKVPGSHAIIKTGGRAVAPGTVLQAAAWAAYQSQARHDTHVSVLVTERRHLARIKGGRPGQVQVRQARSVMVSPRKPPVAS